MEIKIRKMCGDALKAVQIKEGYTTIDLDSLDPKSQEVLAMDFLDAAYWLVGQEKFKELVDNI